MSYSCQRCHQPLIVEESVKHAAKSAIAPSGVVRKPSFHDSASRIEALKAPPHIKSALNAKALSISKHPQQGEPNTHDAITNVNSLSSRLALKTSLFAHLSSPEHAVHHPLCSDCTDGLLELMTSQVDELRRERDTLAAWETQVMSRPSDGGAADTEQSDVAEIARLTSVSEELERSLRQAERERLALEAEAAELAEEERQLEVEENDFWATHSRSLLLHAKLSSRLSSLRTSISHDSALLARLELTNVYNDAFCVGHDGGYATINGLRLGRLPSGAAQPASSTSSRSGRSDSKDKRSVTPEWTEINAAWGQTALLLQILARKCSVTFDGYELHPKGSFSTVEKLGADAATYELYGSSDWQLGRLLHSRRFDHAMVAFLECMRQLMEWACTKDTELRLPYIISKDKIGGASIRLQFGHDETWTRALRHVLLTLKVLLGWVVSDDAAER